MYIYMNLNNYRLDNHVPFETVYILLGKLTNTTNGCFFSQSLFSIINDLRKILVKNVPMSIIKV
jgi:hypothetical protein